MFGLFDSEYALSILLWSCGSMLSVSLRLVINAGMVFKYGLMSNIAWQVNRISTFKSDS